MLNKIFITAIHDGERIGFIGPIYKTKEDCIRFFNERPLRNNSLQWVYYIRYTNLAFDVFSEEKRMPDYRHELE